MIARFAGRALRTFGFVPATLIALGPSGAVFFPPDHLTDDPSKLGNPALIRQRKERSLRQQAALLGFTLQPAEPVAVS